MIKINNKNQQENLIRKLNVCMIYLIKTQCKEYLIDFQRNQIEIYFTYVTKIKKGSIIIYLKSQNSLTKFSMKSDLQNQMKIMSYIIQKELGIKIQFTEICGTIQLQSLKDQNNQSINLNLFLEKYYKFDELCTMKNKIQNEKLMYSKWKYQNLIEIETILQYENQMNKTFEQQKEFLICKLNVCMMNYLLIECKNFHLILNQSKQSLGNEFIYIERIIKKDEIYDIKQTINYYFKDENKNEIEINKFYKKFQIQIISLFLWSERKIQIVFTNDENDLQIISFVDKNHGEMNLIDFIRNYGDYQLLKDLIKQSMSREIEIKIDISEDEENEIVFSSDYLRKRVDNL